MPGFVRRFIEGLSINAASYAITGGSLAPIAVLLIFARDWTFKIAESLFLLHFGPLFRTYEIGGWFFAIPLLIGVGTTAFFVLPWGMNVYYRYDLWEDIIWDIKDEMHPVPICPKCRYDLNIDTTEHRVAFTYEYISAAELRCPACSFRKDFNRETYGEVLSRFGTFVKGRRRTEHWREEQAKLLDKCPELRL